MKRERLLLRRRHTAARSFTARHQPCHFRRLGFEWLEDRRMLSTIQWTNRSTFSGTDDNRFDDVFGAMQNQAIAVVDAAIASWQRVIDNFNYSDNTNTYNITVRMYPSAAGSGAGAVGAKAPPDEISFLDGKPKSENIYIGWRSGITATATSAAGWYLDLTPMDNSEFTTVSNVAATQTNAFFGEPAAALGGVDLFTAMQHELAHAMGLSSNDTINAFATDTAVTDTINMPASLPASTYYRFDSDHVHNLWTSWDSGGTPGTGTNTNGADHFANAGSQVTQAGRTYNGANALMNASYTFDCRGIIDDNLALMLQDAYHYDITLPSFFGTFYDHLDTDGKLVINTPGDGDDYVKLDVLDDSLFVTMTIGAPIPGIDPTTEYTSSFPLSSITSISINTNGGDDVISLFPLSASIPVSVVAGIGDDTLEIYGTIGNDIFIVNTSDLSSAGLNVVSYASSETLSFFQRGGTDDFTMFSRAHETVWVNFYGSGFNEALNIHQLQAGLAGSAVFNLGGTPIVNLGDATVGMQLIQSDVQITNDSGQTLVNINDAPDTTSRTVTIDQIFTSLGLVRGLAPADITWDQSAVGEVNITTGTGNDTIDLLRTGNAIQFHNAGGRDTLTIGNSTNGVQSITGAVTVGPNSGLVFTDVVFNDTADTIGRSVLWAPVVQGGSTIGYEISGLTPGLFYYDYQSVVYLNVLGGSGDDLYVFFGFDDDWAQTVIDGGLGFNSLVVNDRFAVWSPDVADLYPGSIHRGIGLAVGVQDIFFSNIQSPSYYAKNSTTSINVYGVSSSVPAGQQLTVFSGSGDDTLTIYPHDQFGNLTISGNFGYSGGLGHDTAQIDDSLAAPAITYVFENLFGPDTTNIAGMGSAGFGAASDVEQLSVYGGYGSDTFRIESYQSSTTALSIFAGQGLDTFNISPTVKDVAASINSAATFYFDGGENADLFQIDNGNSTSAWNYNRNGDSLTLDRQGAPYLLALNPVNCDFVFVFSGAGSDIMQLDADPNSAFVFQGGGGYDGMLMGVATGTVDNIRTNTVFDAGDDGGYLNIFDFADTTGDVVHVFDTPSGDGLIGGSAGDNLFGPGGFVRFRNLSNDVDGYGLKLYLGSGIDTVYALPLATAGVFVDAGGPGSGSGAAQLAASPASGASEGDVLNLGLATANNYVVQNTGGGSGNVTSTNKQIVSWSSIEQPVAVDDVAPYTVSQQYIASPVSEIDLVLSEDVGASIALGSLYLVNDTIGQQVPVVYRALDYDAGTKMARFTFPGYPGGRLPPGHYTAGTDPGLADAFGNLIGTLQTFTFTIASLPGDYDGNGSVQQADYDVWRSHFGQAAIPFTSADGNGNGVVDSADYIIWRKNLGATLPESGSGTTAVSAASESIAPPKNGQTEAPAESTPASKSLAITELFDINRSRVETSHARRLHVSSAKLANASRLNGLLAISVSPSTNRRGRLEIDGGGDILECLTEATSPTNFDVIDMALDLMHESMRETSPAATSLRLG